MSDDNKNDDDLEIAGPEDAEIADAEADDAVDYEDDAFDEFDQGDSTLGDTMRGNPMAKVGAVVGGFALLLGAIFFLGGGSGPTNVSVLPQGSDASAPPGSTDEVDPAYIEAIEEQNQRRTEDAIQQGTAVIPTPTEAPRGSLTVPEEQEPEEDPLERWRRLQEERLERELERSQTLTPEAPGNTQGNDEVLRQLSELMAEQMQAILDSRGEVQTSQLTLTSPQYLEELREEEEKEAQAEAEAAAAAAAQDQAKEKVLVPAGQILYGQTITEANSDVPGPVLAQVLTSKLQGSRILGSFSVADSEDALILEFDTLVMPDGTSVSIDAVALDPDTTLPGLATEVDNRYLQRIVLPAAAAFVEGAASAIAESGLTTVTIQGETVAEETEETDNEQEIASGVEEAGAELRDILDDVVDDIEPLIRIESGTPFGLLLLSPIFEPTDTTQTTDNTNL